MCRLSDHWQDKYIIADQSFIGLQQAAAGQLEAFRKSYSKHPGQPQNKACCLKPYSQRL